MEIAWVSENYSVWVKSVECDGHAPVKTSLVQEVCAKLLRHGCGHHPEVPCQHVGSGRPWNAPAGPSHISLACIFETLIRKYI